MPIRIRKILPKQPAYGIHIRLVETKDPKPHVSDRLYFYDLDRECLTSGNHEPKISRVFFPGILISFPRVDQMFEFEAS